MRRVAARRRQRGSVLVEAAVVIPAFVILFGGMLFLHHVIREQQRVDLKAKADAWTSAMASCTGDGNALPALPFSSTMPGAPGADISLQNSLGSASASASNVVNVSLLGSGPAGDEGSGFAFTQAVSAHVVVYCDNQTAPGNIGGVFSWLIGNVKELL
jgi:Flp pilus assembly protein TadG